MVGYRRVKRGKVWPLMAGDARVLQGFSGFGRRWQGLEGFGRGWQGRVVLNRV